MSRVRWLELLGGDGRMEARDDALPALLAVDDVLLGGRADDLLAGVRVRVRLAGRPSSAATATSSSSAPAWWRPPFCSPARSPACSPRSSGGSSRSPTTRSSRPRLTCTSSSPPRRPGSRARPASTAARRCSSRSRSGSTRRWGMLLVPLIGFLTGLGFALFGIWVSAIVPVDRLVQLHHLGGAHSAVPRRRHVLPDRPACPTGHGRSHRSTRSTTASQLVRHAAFGLQPLDDLYHAGALTVFAAPDGVPGRAQDAGPADRLTRRVVR